MRKIQRVIIPFVVVLLCTACSISVGNHKQRYSVYGRWKLVDVSGGPGGSTDSVNTSQQLQFNNDNTFQWYHNGSLWAHGKVAFDVENNVKTVKFTPSENVNIVDKAYSLTEQSQLRLIDDCSGCYVYVFDPD